VACQKHGGIPIGASGRCRQSRPVESSTLSATPRPFEPEHPARKAPYPPRSRLRRLLQNTLGARIFPHRIWKAIIATRRDQQGAVIRTGEAVGKITSATPSRTICDRVVEQDVVGERIRLIRSGAFSSRKYPCRQQ